MALYLKYRPQTLNDLIGQESVKKNLLSAFQNKKLSHAYLFVGPRGTGKTSTARIMAKMVNCELSVKNEPENRKLLTDNYAIPCNNCSSCLSITDGSNMDLIEVDAASNRGIDDIRNLRDTIKLASYSGGKKIYIIDEVHMLTTEAFNALLKTLEEPPAHVMFVLATTEVQKVPETILSRAQRIDFKLATILEVTQALKYIVEQEQLTITDEALSLIAKYAEGSFRDGVKLLDQVSSSSTAITIEDVISTVRATPFGEAYVLAGYLLHKDTTPALLCLQKVTEQGSSAKEITLTLMILLRSLLYIKNGIGDVLVKPEFGGEQYLQLVKLGETVNQAALIKAMDYLQTALERLKTSSIQSLPLEIAIISFCYQEQQLTVQTINPELREALSHRPTLVENNLSEEQEVIMPSVSDAVSVKQDDNVTTPQVALLQEKWTFVLDSVKPYNFSLEALLRHVKIREVESGIVTLEVPYSFHQRILEAAKSRDLLESILSDILNEQIRISCVLGAKRVTIEDLANVEIAADDEIVKAAAEIFTSDSTN